MWNTSLLRSNLSLNPQTFPSSFTCIIFSSDFLYSWKLSYLSLSLKQTDNEFLVSFYTFLSSFGPRRSFRFNFFAPLPFWFLLFSSPLICSLTGRWRSKGVSPSVCLFSSLRCCSHRKGSDRGQVSVYVFVCRYVCVCEESHCFYWTMLTWLVWRHCARIRSEGAEIKETVLSCLLYCFSISSPLMCTSLLRGISRFRIKICQCQHWGWGVKISCEFKGATCKNWTSVKFTLITNRW